MSFQLRNINSKMAACKGKNTTRGIILQGWIQDVEGVDFTVQFS
jgi:hypothetical protein